MNKTDDQRMQAHCQMGNAYLAMPAPPELLGRHLSGTMPYLRSCPCLDHDAARSPA